MFNAGNQTVFVVWSYSALLTQLSRGFFEQQYQSALIQLNSESSADKERLLDELNDELNSELQRQMKVLFHLCWVSSVIAFPVSLSGRSMFCVSTL